MQFLKKFIILLLPLFLCWSIMLYIYRGSVNLEDVKIFSWFGTIETMEFDNLLDRFQSSINTVRTSFYSSLFLIRTEALSISNANNILSVLKSLSRIWYNIFSIFTLPMTLITNVFLLVWNFSVSILINIWEVFKFFYAPLL